MRFAARVLSALAMSGVLTSAHAQPPAEQFADILSSLMMPAGSEGSYDDWSSLESVKQIRWQPLPPNMLDDALPDGSYFTRKGLANVGGLPFGVVATGARTMVINVYFRNVSATPMGENLLLDTLRRGGYTLTLARCPVKGAAGGGSRWWHLEHAGKRAAWLNSQTSCDGRKCEGYALLLGDALPTLPPQQRNLYTDQCAGNAAGTPMAPVAAWDAQLAALFEAFMPPARATSVPWTAIDAASAVTWAPMPPQEMQTPPWSDTENHFYRGGQADLGGRVLYLTATGTRDSVRTIHVEDQSTLANRGDPLVVLRSQGYAVELVRCGKVYQLSSGKWYRVTGRDKHPAVLKREVRCDTVACPRGQETYALALDGRLPPLQSGEVDAVGGSCPGR